MSINHRHVLNELFKRLLAHYGPRRWWPARTRFEVIAGAILVQNVSWKNAKIAITSLKKHKLLDPHSISSRTAKELAPLIRSSRFYNQKARTLKNFSSHLIKIYGGSLDKMFSSDTAVLRKELLAIKGIGRETADSILLYAGSKPTFVSDAYTKRLLTRYGIRALDPSYDEIRELFMRNIPEDVRMYNEYHALIVHHGHATCKPKPDCPACPIKRIDKKTGCKFFKGAVLAAIIMLAASLASFSTVEAAAPQNRPTWREITADSKPARVPAADLIFLRRDTISIGAARIQVLVNRATNVVEYVLSNVYHCYVRPRFVLQNAQDLYNRRFQ